MHEYNETTIDWPRGRKGVLSAGESRAFRRAQEDSFLKTRSQAWRLGLAWCGWCAAHGQPVVRVKERRGRAQVLIDLITTDEAFSPAAQDAVIRAFKRCNAPKWACGADAAHATVDRKLGEPLARELLDIVEALRRAA